MAGGVINKFLSNYFCLDGSEVAIRNLQGDVSSIPKCSSSLGEVWFYDNSNFAETGLYCDSDNEWKLINKESGELIDKEPSDEWFCKVPSGIFFVYYWYFLTKYGQP